MSAKHTHMLIGALVAAVIVLKFYRQIAAQVAKLPVVGPLIVTPA